MNKDITMEEIINTLKHTHKWKSEIDEITNFWLHHSSSNHQLMRKFISEIIKEPEKYLIGARKELFHSCNTYTTIHIYARKQNQQ